MSRDFAEVFAPGSRPEVPIVGRIASAGGAPIAVAGQVDRLIVTGDAVLIADYKTDQRRAAPSSTKSSPMSPSSRFTARCWRGFIPARPCARH